MTKVSAFLIGFTLLFFQNASFAQISQPVRGNISDATNQQKLARVTVSLAETEYKTFTNENGDFIIKNVPPGRYTAIVTNVGYSTKKITELLLQSGKELILNVTLEPSVNQLSETTVTATSPNLSGALTSINTITTEQVMRYPATFMDPARLAQSFAGVAVNNDQSNGISELIVFSKEVTSTTFKRGDPQIPVYSWPSADTIPKATKYERYSRANRNPNFFSASSISSSDTPDNE
jgi:hypothetical protein